MTAAVLLAALAAAAPVPAATSAYTPLDLDRCRRVDRVVEPQSATWRCRGHAGVPLIVQSGDDRYDLDAGREDRDEFWGESFDYPGKTVEWRLRRGKPFAIIYRLESGGDAAKSSRLIVETIGGKAPGCRVAEIDGRLPNANQRARAAADRIRPGVGACMRAARR